MCADTTLFRVFPGPLHEQNQGCIDWGWANLVAYGSHSYVVIVDVLSLNRVQTLDAHPSNVIRVKWSPKTLSLANFTSNERTKPFRLLLASGDTQGNVFIWDTLQAEILVSLVGGPLIDMAWHPSVTHLFAALYQPSSLVLWNIQTGQKLWVFQFKDPITSIKFNPFDQHHLCAATEHGMIYFVRDLNENQKPSQIDLKYRITGSQSNTSSTSYNTSGDTDKHDFVEMRFSPHSRNIIYFLLKRRILIFDIGIHQAIGSIGIDRNKASFAQVLPCRQRSQLLFCLHKDGSMTAWHKQKDSFTYDLQCTLDLLMTNIHMRKQGLLIFGTANGITPHTEKLIAAIRSDGTIIVTHYHDRVVRMESATSVAAAVARQEQSESLPLRKALVIPRAGKVQPGGIQLGELLNPSTAKSEEMYEVIESGRLAVTGMIPALSPGISSLVSCPYQGYTYLVAVGTTTGLVQLIDLKQSHIFAEFRSPHHLNVRGLRWLDLRRVIFFTIEQAEKTRYRNYICVLDIDCGKFSYIRKKSEAESTYIRAIRPSPSGKYVVVLLKDQPFQIWDLESGNLLKSIKLPVQLTAMSWAPTGAITSQTPGNTSPFESFIFTTPDGSTHHYKIENHVITPAPLQAQTAVGLVQGIAWQDQYLASGDSTGTIFVWNFDKKKFQGFSTERGSIKRIQFPSPPLPTPQQVSIRLPPKQTTPQLLYRLSRHAVQVTTKSPSGSSQNVAAPLSALPPTSPRKGSTSDARHPAAPSSKRGPGYSQKPLQTPVPLELHRDADDYNRSFGSDQKLVPISDDDVSMDDMEYSSESNANRTGNSTTSGQPTAPAPSTNTSTGIFGNTLLANVFANLTGGGSSNSTTASTGNSSTHTDTHQHHTPPPTWISNHPGLHPDGSPEADHSGRHRLLTHFGNGSCIIWDLDQNVRLSTSSYLNQRGLSAIAVDWVSHSQPIIACNDGALRIFDKTQSVSNSPIHASVFSRPLQTPILLPEVDAILLKTMLLHHVFLEPTHPFAVAYTERKALWNLVDPQLLEAIQGVMKTYGNRSSELQPETRPFPVKGIVIAKCALLIAQYFGSNFEIEFWTATSDFFATRKNPIPSTATFQPSNSSSRFRFTTVGPEAGHSGTTVTANASPSKKNTKEKAPGTDLPDYFDLLLGPDKMHRLQNNRARVLLERGKQAAVGHHITQRLADTQLFLGNKSVAVELLLASSTNSDNHHHVQDALTACVIAATIDQDTFHNTVKMVATNLMAHDKIDAGVRLLCLIGRGFDACRYLQYSERWTEAAWIAKIHLSEPDCTKIMQKWAEHLIASKKPESMAQALNILLTQGDVHRVFFTMANSTPQWIDVAAVFATAVLADNLIHISSARESIQAIFSTYSQTLTQLAMSDALAQHTGQTPQSQTQTSAAAISHLNSEFSLLANYYLKKAELVASDQSPPPLGTDYLSKSQKNDDQDIRDISSNNKEDLDEETYAAQEGPINVSAHMSEDHVVSANNNADPFAMIFDGFKTSTNKTPKLTDELMDIDVIDNQ